MIKFERISKSQFEKDWIWDKKFSGVAYDNVKLPTRATARSAGYDFYSPINFILNPGEAIVIPTGIRAKMSDGTVLLLYVRSSIGIKHGVVLCNGTGVVDADYYDAENEGHICCALRNLGKLPFSVNVGDRIMQGVFTPFLTIDEKERATGKRTGGVGSTGK